MGAVTQRQHAPCSPCPVASIRKVPPLTLLGAPQSAAAPRPRVPAEEQGRQGCARCRCPASRSPPAAAWWGLRRAGGTEPLGMRGPCGLNRRRVGGRWAAFVPRLWRGQRASLSSADIRCGSSGEGCGAWRQPSFLRPHCLLRPPGGVPLLAGLPGARLHLGHEVSTGGGRWECCLLGACSLLGPTCCFSHRRAKQLSSVPQDRASANASSRAVRDVEDEVRFSGAWPPPAVCLLRAQSSASPCPHSSCHWMTFLTPVPVWI